MTLTAEQVADIEAALRRCVVLETREQQCPDCPPPQQAPAVDPDLLPTWAWVALGAAVGVVAGSTLTVLAAQAVR